MARLKVGITKSLEKVYKLRNGMTIGRDPKNHIQLLAQPVSRNHAQFIVDGDGVSVLDLGSSNGTKVNGERISQVELQEGDVIDIGNIFMTFEKEVPHVADENIFTLEQVDLPEDKMDEIANRRELGLILPSDADFVDLAYNISRKYLEVVGLDDDDNVNILTALYEAMDNAKRHGNKSDISRKIRLYFINQPEKISVSVVDEGEGFDYASVLQKTDEQDALSAARERYMAGGMGGLGIRLMLKCVDKIGYEQEGSKIVLTKLKEPVESDVTDEKELTTVERAYKTALWDEIAKTGEKLPERQGKIAERLSGEPEEQLQEGGSARPEGRIKNFEDRLSKFFMSDGGDGLREVSGQELAGAKEGAESPKSETEPDSSGELQINVPDHIKTDKPEDTDKNGDKNGTKEDVDLGL